MKIEERQILYRKTIGNLDKSAVIEICTIGGLKIVGVQERNGKIKTLGAGSHRAVARYLAQKAEPGIRISALEKSEDVHYADFKDLLPFWQSVVERLNSRD
jgi:hypothetical protein